MAPLCIGGLRRWEGLPPPALEPRTVPLCNPLGVCRVSRLRIRPLCEGETCLSPISSRRISVTLLYQSYRSRPLLKAVSPSQSHRRYKVEYSLRRCFSKGRRGLPGKESETKSKKVFRHLDRLRRMTYLCRNNRWQRIVRIFREHSRFAQSINDANIARITKNAK